MEQLADGTQPSCCKMDIFSSFPTCSRRGMTWGLQELCQPWFYVLVDPGVLTGEALAGLRSLGEKPGVQ